VTGSRQTNPRLAFGLAVRKLRHSRGISQEKLAELAEIHRTYIGDVERGTRNIALVNMTRIASALRVPLSSLIKSMEENDNAEDI
jgi:transcriptional regulator with XRE-family HTH domain